MADAGKGDFEASQQGWSGRVDPDGNLHQFVTSRSPNAVANMMPS